MPDASFPSLNIVLSCLRPEANVAILGPSRPLHASIVDSVSICHAEAEDRGSIPWQEVDLI